MQKSMKNVFLFQFFSTEVEFLSQVFLKQVKIVVTEKNEFNKRYVSNLVNLFRKFWIIMFLLQLTESTVSQEMVCQKLKSINCEFDRTNQLGV